MCLCGPELFIEFLPLPPSVRLVPLFHDKLSINSHVAILTVSKERGNGATFDLGKLDKL